MIIIYDNYANDLVTVFPEMALVHSSRFPCEAMGLSISWKDTSVSRPRKQ